MFDWMLFWSPFPTRVVHIHNPHSSRYITRQYQQHHHSSRSISSINKFSIPCNNWLCSKKKKWKIVASNCEYWHANFSIFLLNDWVALFNVHQEPTISAAVLHMLYHQSDISHSFVTQRAPYVRLLYAICIWKYFAIANFYVIFNSSEVTVRNTAVACKWTYDAVDASTVRIFIYIYIWIY